MFRRARMLDLIAKTCMEVKPGQRVLIVADDRALSIEIGRQLAQACDTEGAEVVMNIMAPRQHVGQEPPAAVAEAMQVCDIVAILCEGPSIAHTNAAKASREKGIKNVLAGIRYGEEHFNREISVADLNRIKERSERVAEIVSRANVARVTSSLGTDLRMSLKGRKGIPLHPLSGAAITTVPDYAEVAVSPVEGSTEGVLVTEGGVRRWDLPLKEPLRLSVKGGRITEVSGPEDYVERFKNLIAMDQNASNCAAELGIGTTHTMPKKLISSGVLLGTIHIAVGRNNDIGGETYSKIHNDLLIYKPTVWLDDLCLIKDGELKV